MNNQASRWWLFIIFISIVIMWVLEFNGTIDQLLEKEKQAAALKKEKIKFQMEDKKRAAVAARNEPTYEDLDDTDKETSIQDIIKMNEYYLSELEKSRGPSPGQLLEKTKSAKKEEVKQDGDGLIDELEPLRVYIDEETNDLYSEENKSRRKKRDLNQQAELEQQTAQSSRQRNEQKQLSRRKRACDPTDQAEKDKCAKKIKTTTVPCKNEPTPKEKTDCVTAKTATCEADPCAYFGGGSSSISNSGPNNQTTAGGDGSCVEEKEQEKCEKDDATHEKTYESEPPAKKPACLTASKAKCKTTTFCDFLRREGETLRQKCNPISPRGKKPSRFESNLPPCHLYPPAEIEPVPAHLYRGTLEFGQECWPMTRIAEEQAKGLPDYPPETERPELSREQEVKYKNMNAGVEKKAQEIDKHTCIVRKGLECIDMDTHDEKGVKMNATTHRCGCMNAFGGKASERFQINGTCYIPADAGDLSACFGDIGLPLPSGDTYNKLEWNPVKLKCTPGAVCIESSHWIGKRCTCKKGDKLEEDGTCSFATSLLAFSASSPVFQIVIAILTVISSTNI